jgi:signal transduction histidine kinase
MTRFNEAIDEALAESVGRYSDDVGRSRDTFVAILGHDLRSPLLAITASSGMLSDATAAETVKAEAVSRIRNSTLAMSQMISDLLEYTRTRLGKGIPIKPGPANLEAILRGSLDEVQAGYPQRSFRFESGGDLAADVDAPRLQQAVTNLLSNAVRHGRPGTAVKVVAREENESLSIEVSNEGPMIAKEALEVMFDPMMPYERIPGKPRSASIGLGLFIAREIASGHGGSIEAASTERATSFTIRIPRRAAVVAEAVPTE